MEKTEIAILMTVLFVFGGAIVAFYPDPYEYDVSFSNDGSCYRYEFSSNVDVETSSIVISNTGLFDLSSILVCYDESFSSINPHADQLDFIEIFEKHAEIRSIEAFEVVSSEEMLECMDLADERSTALMFLSGSIPVTLYDGTSDCPLIQWLDRGGMLINIAGTLGKYYSNGPDFEDIVEVEGFGKLFGDVDDDCFAGYGDRCYALDGDPSRIHEWLHADLNECTFGTRYSELDQALNLGYVSEEGYTSACAFKSHEGMIFNFGCSLADYNHSSGNIAQILASGIDYSSVLVERHVGDTRGDSEGYFDIEGDYSIYCFIGSSRVLFADRIQTTAIIQA